MDRALLRALVVAALWPVAAVALYSALGPVDTGCEPLATPGRCPPFGADVLGHSVLALALRSTASTLVHALTAYVLGCVLAFVCGGLATAATLPAVRELFRGAHLLFTGIPPVLGALVLLRVVPNGAAALVLALVFLSWPRLFKALESRLLSDQGKGYRLAAAACGVPLHRFLVRYLGPSAFAVFLALAPLELAELVALEATLGFLGVGASDPEASLGRLVAEGRGLATVRPWAFAVPVAFLALLLAGFLWASAVRGRAAYG